MCVTHYDCDPKPVDHGSGLLKLLSNQLRVLFEWQGLKEPGLRLLDRGSMMDCKSHQTMVLFQFNMS